MSTSGRRWPGRWASRPTACSSSSRCTAPTSPWRAVAPWTRPQADIVVTDDPDVAIAVRVADCAPVLLHDPVNHAVGAAHAGWRGTAAGAAAAAVRAMQRTFGSHVSDLVA